MAHRRRRIEFTLGRGDEVVAAACHCGASPTEKDARAAVDEALRASVPWLDDPPPVCVICGKPLRARFFLDHGRAGWVVDRIAVLEDCVRITVETIRGLGFGDYHAHRACATRKMPGLRLPGNRRDRP